MYNIQTVVTSLHVKFLIVNLFNFIHRARRFEKEKVFPQGGHILAYNEIFSTF